MSENFLSLRRYSVGVDLAERTVAETNDGSALNAAKFGKFRFAKTKSKNEVINRFSNDKANKN